MTKQEKQLKRFYKIVSTEHRDDRWAILLDGRMAKTVARNMLAAPTEPLAAAIAAEWVAQDEFIERHLMPLTVLLSASIDNTDNGDYPTEEILKFLKTDLVCYRADAPSALVERQSSVWDPYIEWLEAAFGARLIATKGIVAVAQSEKAIAAIRKFLARQTPTALYGIRTATEITGSAVLGLALWKGGFEPTAIFDASCVDENFQEERWGVDAEAAARTQKLAGDFGAVARFLSLL